MAGLDAVSSNFMPGEIVAPTDATPAAKNPLDDMARFIPAGGPKGSKGVLDASDSADILAKMEEFIKQRSQPKEPTILGGIGNALSAASMSLYHPEAYVQKQKNEADLAQQNAKDTLDMQMQIAQFKAAQEQQKAYAKRLENVFGSGEQGQPQAATPGQPQAATPGQPQTAASVVTTSGGQKFSVNDLPPAIRAAAYAQPDFASMMKVIDTWAQKNAEQAQQLSNNLALEATKSGYNKELEPVKFANSSDANTQKVYFINGKEVMMTPLEYSKRANVPVEQAIQTGNSTAPATAASTASLGTFDPKKSYGTPSKLLDNLGIAESSDNPYAVHPDSKAMGKYQFLPDTAALLNKQGIKFNPLDADESRAAADYYIQQLVKQNGGDYAKAMAQYGGFKTKDPSKYLAQVLNGVDLKAPAVTTTSPEVTPVTTKSPAEEPQGYSEFKQQQEAQKALAQGEQSKTGQDFAAKHAAAIQAADNAPEDLANAKYIRNIITNNPKAFGVLQHPTVLAALGTAISEGLNSPATGYTHVSSLDDAVRKLGGSEQDIVAAQKAAQKFAELQLNKAKVVLKGQGSVSDNERRLVSDMTGNIKNSPAALRDMLTWGEMRSNYDDTVGTAMKNWERKNPNSSYRQFELSPEYETLKANYKKQILAFADKAGNYTVPKVGTPIKKPAGYDEWKKSNG